MTSTPITEDFEAIKARLAELARDKKPAEAPKASPDYSGAESVYGMYATPSEFNDACRAGLTEFSGAFEIPDLRGKVYAAPEGHQHAEYALQQQLRSQSYIAPDYDPA